MVVAKDRRNVDAVPKATNAESHTQTDRVGDATSEEPDDGECGVYTNVGSIDIVRIEEATSAQAVHGVEHART